MVLSLQDMMAPTYEAAAKALEPRTRLVKLNSDNEESASARLGVRGLLTMIQSLTTT